MNNIKVTIDCPHECTWKEAYDQAQIDLEQDRETIYMQHTWLQAADALAKTIKEMTIDVSSGHDWKGNPMEASYKVTHAALVKVFDAFGAYEKVRGIK